MSNRNILAFIAFTLFSLCSSSTIHSKNFCKLTTKKECSRRNAPHIYQCGPNMCTKKQTECNEYMRVYEKIKFKGLITFIDAMSSRQHYMNLRLIEDFKRFKSNAKNCTLTRYEWQPIDMCKRGRNCFKKKLNFMIHTQTKKVNCPCSNSKPHVCGSRYNYCALNKEACDSFRYTTSQILNYMAPIHVHSIKKCENDFSFI